MIQIIRTILLKCHLATMLALLHPAMALSCSHTGEVPRTVVALFDGSRESSPRYTRIHRYLEMPMNHLGYRLVYQDISTEFPVLPEAPVAATVSWFDSAVGDPAGLAAWVATLTNSCGDIPALLVLGHTGLSEAVAASDQAAAYLARLGLAYESGGISLGPASTVEMINPLMVGNETDFALPLGTHPRYVALRDTESQLRLLSGAAVVDLLVLAPNALYAEDSVLMSRDPRGGTLWVADPFSLLTHALPQGSWPIPDTTTLSGRRIFFATVGSEGWNNRLAARQFGEQPPLASEILDTELISAYPSLPVSVALLAGDLEPVFSGLAAVRGREVATHLFSLPHVQAATTGFSMIRDWNFFATYDSQSEADLLAKGVRRNADEGIVVSAMQNLSGAFSTPITSALDITPFAPRKYAQLAFDLETETEGAIAAIAVMAPDDSTTPLFVWSGDAMPFPDAIGVVGATGAANIGGGGGLSTVTRPSFSQLWAFGFETEAGVQVYNALSGDAAYTDFWTSGLYGFQALSQTLDRTETPRRLKPFQLSFAARSAVDFASRSAVKRHLDLAEAASVTPVTAARYTKAVEGFYRMKAITVDHMIWQIENRGGLQTVRFDDASALALDFNASQGIVGARRKDASLYVALDPTSETPRVALVESEAPSGIMNSEAAPVLVQARAEILGTGGEECRYEATVKGFGPAEFEWHAQPVRSYEVTLFEPDGTTRRQWEQITTDEDGRLELELPLAPGVPLKVQISSACPEG